MSVLIKGMEMPKESAVTITVYSDGVVIRDLYEEHNYEAVEVPTPHGRLIDADELHEKMYHEAFEVDSDMQKWEGGCWIRYKVFENCKNQTPTIIEAEE